MTHDMTFTNHLANETSPYLLQHVHNPVDWYPWGEDALRKAREENKPIFLSIGYAACHWCHVMEQESFENEDVAAILNEHFISIKVDREERPDLDEIYMTVVQMLTGSGGWPMTVFLTPDREPFFGGTYFPPEDRWGRPGFKSLLTQIAEVWEKEPAKVAGSAQEITQALLRQVGGAGTQGTVNASLIAGAVGDLSATFDAQRGGFGEAPKFPGSQSVALLLREYQRTHNQQLLTMATKTLDEMSYGGMYDQLGGGFHRYSVDAEWLVPHFEKMLYDNAQLAQVYIEAWQLTGREHYRQIVEEILAYVNTQMTDEKGGFFSTEDADSEGEEGKFYIWTKAQIVEILGKDGAFLCDYYQVEADGNFSSHESYHEGQNILHLGGAPAACAQSLGMSREALLAKLEPLRQKLLEVRAKRVRPGLDDKILVAWNGMMISAYARAAQAFGEERHLHTAQRAADFILKDLRDNQGQLLHTYRHGKAKLPAYLDDYALLANALCDVYEASFDQGYLDAAGELTEHMLESFWDSENGGLFFTGDAHRHLLARTKSSYDGATPSGNSVAALLLQRLAILQGREDYAKKAETILRLNVKNMERSPRGFMQMLLGVDFYLYPPKEIVIVGAPESEGVKQLLHVVHGQFLPNRVLAVVDPLDDESQERPLVAGKTQLDGQATAYVCRNFACQRPVTKPADLKTQLENAP